MQSHITTLAGVRDSRFLSGLRSGAPGQADLELASEAHTVSQTLAMVRSLQPDILLLDFEMLDGDLAPILLRINAESPRTKILLIFEGRANGVASEALELGVRGCITKSCSPEDCLRAIRAVRHKPGRRCVIDWLMTCWRNAAIRNSRRTVA